jgi:hypothetical protein
MKRDATAAVYPAIDPDPSPAPDGDLVLSRRRHAPAGDPHALWFWAAGDDARPPSDEDFWR